MIFCYIEVRPAMLWGTEEDDVVAPGDRAADS
jgi:hypothetical protein